MELGNSSKKWVLIVDDDLEIREAISEIIKSQFTGDIGIVQAVDGVEATNKINQQKFHCIVTDIKMPKKEGESFIRTVRKNNFNELTPVIVVSGSVKQDIEGRLPFIYFVSKPFDSVALVDLIKKLVEVGTTKEKLSVGIFNDMLSFTSEFLEKIVKTEKVEVGEAICKYSNEPILAEYASVICVKIGKVNNTFSILASKSDLEILVQKIGGSDLGLEKVYRSMHSVIVDHVMLKNKIDIRRDCSTRYIDSKDVALKSAQGIIIPLVIGDIHLKLFATAS